MHSSSVSTRLVLLILMFLALLTSGASAAIALVLEVETTPQWWTGWLQNFSTEMFGAAVTFILLELVVSRAADLTSTAARSRLGSDPWRDQRAARAAS